MHIYDLLVNTRGYRDSITSKLSCFPLRTLTVSCHTSFDLGKRRSILKCIGRVI